MSKRFSALLVTFAALLLLLTNIGAQNTDLDDILTRMESARGEDLWKIRGEIEQIGRSAIPDLQEALSRANPWVRLGASNALYGFGRKSEAVDSILTVLKGKDEDAKVAGGRLLASLVKDDFGYGDTDALKKQIKDLLKENKTERIQVALYSASLAIDEDIASIRKLRKLVDAADLEAAADAALTLAEIGQYEAAEDTLKRLSKEPTERGRAAKAYLLNYELTKTLETATRPDRNYDHDYALLEEIISLLDQTYYDPSKIDAKKLITDAARGIGNGLDTFSAYYDEQAMADLMEGLTGNYAGIGARVSMRADDSGNTWLTIEQPIYSGPAYAAGLRANDRISEIEGEASVNKELSELVKELRGEPGTEVRIKVYRRGWTEEKEFKLTRRAITLETTVYNLLPGKIGYLSLATFGPNTAKEVGDALGEMLGDGMKALVLDLRGNPGGYLDAAVGVVDHFLPAGKEVVSIVPRNKDDRRVLYTKNPSTGDYPMVVLVNGSSASASEITCGALQDHDRAVLVGERTYGKGSVQRVFDLNTTDKKTGMRVTTALYYLPSGRSIHREKDAKGRGGVAVDIEVKPAIRDFWKDFELEKARNSDVVDEWLMEDDRLKKNEELFRKLAVDDGLDWARYPGFEELYKESGTKVSKDEFRELVRDVVRLAVADLNGKDWRYDLQRDTQLHRGIIELAGKVDINLKEIESYKVFADQAEAAAAPEEKKEEKKDDAAEDKDGGRDF